MKRLLKLFTSPPMPKREPPQPMKLKDALEALEGAITGEGDYYRGQRAVAVAVLYLSPGRPLKN